MTITEIVPTMQSGWNRGDGADWAASFAADAEFVDALGRIQRGREVIASEHQKLFDTIYRHSTVDMEVLRQKPVGHDVTLMHVKSTLRVAAGPRAGEWPAIITLIIIGGEIAAFHNTMQASLAEVSEEDEDLSDRDPLDWNPIDT